MTTAAFTAKDVQELRQRTGAGMMDCKKALEQNAGDMEKSIEYLRKKGIAKAETRAGRSTSEGIVVAETNENAGVLVEVNCETDFVARTDDFKSLARSLATAALADKSISSADALLGSTQGGKKVDELVKEASAKLGEALSVRRVARVEGTVGRYVHFNGKIGVLVALEGAKGADAVALANTLAEHVAAANPLGIDKDSVPSDKVEKERVIFTEQVRQSGKPENMIEKIVTGKVEAYYRDDAQMHQARLREPKQTITQVVADAAKKIGATPKVTRFVRFQLGEE